MARIELDGVAKSWDKAQAVERLDLDIADGEFLAILGPSGCGKSTTLFMLAGIYRPSAGEIRFDGARVNDVEARDRNIGIVFQSYALYPNMTVLQNILFPLRFKKMPRQEAERAAHAAADLVRIGELLGRRPAELSGGQQQRVALARALVKRPQLLLLDEPLSNLDAALRLNMRAEIRRLTRELGLTTILVTHDQIEAMTMADRVLCMNAGRVEQIGPPAALHDRPDTAFVAGFIGSPPMNLLDAEITGGGLRVGSRVLGLAGAIADGPVRLGLRPEHLRATEAGDLAGTVTAAEALGRETLYALDTPLGALHLLDPGPRPRFAPGARIGFGFAPEASLIFDRTSGRRLDGVHAHV